MLTPPLPPPPDIDKQVMRLKKVLDHLVHTWPVPRSQPPTDPPDDGAQDSVDAADGKADLD
ncbi:UNVERIFIED_CONTAM: hypothetical protein Slati_3087900 [Sesamum latifolium]|uniref:Uncharacterized protein n=1 Tax=Sesamum latifolium TaxID=2727402 RepID=A0AAW2UUP6_9LAMI